MPYFVLSVQYLMGIWLVVVYYILAITNNVAMNICVQVFVQTYVYSSLGYI